LKSAIEIPPQGTIIGKNMSKALNIRVDDVLTVKIIDQESEFYNRTISVTGSSISEGGIVFANNWEVELREIRSNGNKENITRKNTTDYLHKRNEPKKDTEDDVNYYKDSEPPSDLITLTHLHEPAVVFCLRQRYQSDEIYTATGPILLALNPFKDCGNLYSEATMTMYWDRGESVAKGHVVDNHYDASISKRSGHRQSKGRSHYSPSNNAPLPPHAYKVADDAFRSMMRNLEDKSSFANQSILVSGESGAGKTVTTKIIMSYLAMLSRRSVVAAVSRHVSAQLEFYASPREQYGGKHKGIEPSPPPSPTPTANIEQQVLESNPILESFGNARTIRNDNSSRFGKFIEIQFTHRGCLVGAHVDTYLLEKVRLINQTPGERNFHIFYELLSSDGPSPDLKHQLHLHGKKPHDFRMTAGSGTFARRDGVKDEDTFADLVEAMDCMGFDSEEQYSVLHAAAALLHASNLTLSAVTADESRIDRSASLRLSCEMLGVSPKDFEDSICFTTMTISAAGESLRKTLSKEKATQALEALMKASYGAMFQFLVQRINALIACRNHAEDSLGKHSSSSSFIGLLDIFGFESFDVNSFEQLCINYCNEALQQQFNKFVFKMEQQEYENEEISWSFIEFPDNQDVLQLIDDKRTGVLSILDDMCLLSAKNTDSSFAEAIYKKCMNHSRFSASRKQQTLGMFSIKHYAGSVEYNTTNFLEKNKDELSKEATDLLLGSSNMFIQALGYILSNPVSSRSSVEKTQNGGIAKRNKSSLVRVSVGGQFAYQLRQLRERINKTAPHYIRCIKPNDDLVPNRFDCAVVLDQLRCNGILEAVRVSRVGYSQRYLHESFVKRYQILAPQPVSRNSSMFIGGKSHNSGEISDKKTECQNLVNTLAPELIKHFKTEEEQSPTEMRNSRSISEDPAITRPTNTFSKDKMRYSSSSNQYLDRDLIKLGIQVGRTKVFLRHHAFEVLEQLRGIKRSSSATIIVSIVRMFLARCRLLKTLQFEGVPRFDFYADNNTEVESMGLRKNSNFYRAGETYEASMAIALKNIARPQAEAWTRDPTQFKWVVVDGIWVKNRKVIDELAGSTNLKFKTKN